MNKEAFYAEVRAKLGRLDSRQVQGFEAVLAASDGLKRSHRAYCLATGWHETGTTMQPIKETERKGVKRSDQQVVNVLDNAWRKGLLGQVKIPYWRFDSSGKAWFGRGLVQLTHRTNYAKAAKLTGFDILGDPTLALRMDVAAKILVDGSETGMFTGKKLGDFLPDDPIGARAVINGVDRALDIAGYYEVFNRALQAAGVSESAQPRTPTTPTVQQVPRVGGGVSDSAQPRTPTTPTVQQVPRVGGGGVAPSGIAIAIGATLTAVGATLAAFWDKITAIFGG